MKNCLKVKASWGDSFVISSIEEGMISASLENSKGVKVLDVIDVMGLYENVNLDILQSVSPRILSTRFKLSRYNDRPVLLYTEGLKGGGSCASSAKHREKLESKNVSKSALDVLPDKDNNPAISYLPISKDNISFGASLPLYKDKSSIEPHSVLPLTEEKMQEQIYSYVTQTKDAVEKCLKVEIKIMELNRVHPTDALYPELISIELIKILLIESI